MESADFTAQQRSGSIICHLYLDHTGGLLCSSRACMARAPGAGQSCGYIHPLCSTETLSKRLCSFSRARSQMLRQIQTHLCSRAAATPT